MRKVKVFLMSLLFILGIGLGAINAHAAVTSFSVNPVLPSNQATPGVTYWDLLMKPGANQKLSVQLANTSGKEVKVEMKVNSAVTADSGAVVYGLSDIKSDKSLKYSTEELVNIPKEVVLPVGAKKTVEIQVNMPKDSFNGIVAGGISFQEKKNNQEKDKENKGFSIKNTFSYNIGLLMRQSNTVVAPKLNLKEVEASQVNYRNVISANLQNSAMGYLNNMNVDAQITGLSNQELNYKMSNSTMQMAPNTNFNFNIPVSLQGSLKADEASKPLQAGKYHLKMTVYGQKDDNGPYSKTVDGKKVNYAYKWTFDRDFEITSQQANSLNEKDLTVKKDKTWIYWLIASALLFLIMLILVFILWKHRKNDKKENQTEILKAQLAEAQAKIQAEENKKLKVQLAEAQNQLQKDEE